jgi:hypothetical protein
VFTDFFDGAGHLRANQSDRITEHQSHPKSRLRKAAGRCPARIDGHSTGIGESRERLLRSPPFSYGKGMNESHRHRFRRFLVVALIIVATAVLAIGLDRQIRSGRQKTNERSMRVAQADTGPPIAVSAVSAKAATNHQRLTTSGTRSRLWNVPDNSNTCFES